MIDPVERFKELREGFKPFNKGIWTRSKICTFALCVERRSEIPNFTYNLYDKFGYTALHTAAELAVVNDDEAILPIITRLIDGGMPVEIETIRMYSKPYILYKLTPLMVAVLYAKRSIKAVQLLLKRGANVNMTTLYQYTPLMLSVAYESLSKECTQELLNAGADPNAKNIYNETALSLAAYRTPSHSSDIVKMLIDAGAEVNSCNAWGETPLIQSLKKRPYTEDVVNIARCLIEAGSNLRQKDKQGETALMAVARKGHLPYASQIIRLILEKDPSTREQKNSWGAPAYHMYTGPKYYPRNLFGFGGYNPPTKKTALSHYLLTGSDVEFLCEES